MPARDMLRRAVRAAWLPWLAVILTGEAAWFGAGIWRGDLPHADEFILVVAIFTFGLAFFSAAAFAAVLLPSALAIRLVSPRSAPSLLRMSGVLTGPLMIGVIVVLARLLFSGTAGMGSSYWEDVQDMLFHPLALLQFAAALGFGWRLGADLKDA